MPERILKAKPGKPIIRSDDLLAFLTERGVNVKDDTVEGRADGSVMVDTLATTSLDEAWAAYVPPAPPPPPPSIIDTLAEKIDATNTLEELKAMLIADVLPVLVAPNIADPTRGVVPEFVERR